MGAIASPLIGHMDAPLTNFAKKFRNNERIADRIAPAVPVGRQTDKYNIFGRESRQLTEHQLRAAGAPAERIRIKLSTDSYSCVSMALAAEIPDEARAAYAETGEDIEQDAVQTMMDKILLQREKDLAAMLTDTAQVTNNVTLAGANQWSNDASTPWMDVQTAMDKIVEIGLRPNFIAVGWPVFAKLRWHPGVKKSLVATGRQVALSLTDADLAAFFGVDEFLVGAAAEDSKADPPVASFVWGKNAIVGYRSPSPSRQDPSGVKTFRWTAAPGTAGGIGVVKARNADPTAKGDIVGVDDYYDLKITAVEALYLIKAAVA